MPRKSTSSNSAGGTVISMPSNSNNGAGGPGQDGDVSMLSVATDASTTTATSKPRVNGKTAKEENDSVGIDDLLLPRTLTSRLARGILPANTSIQKDALLALTKAATVFINYLAHNANELTQKKTVGPQDVLKAIEEIEMAGVMGLGQVGPDGKPNGRLERELEAFENVVKGKRKGYREKVKARESGTSHPNDERMSPDGDQGEEREAKRARFEHGAEEDAQHSDQHAAPGNNLTTMLTDMAPSSSSSPSLQKQHQASPSKASPLIRHATNGALPYHLPHNDFEDDQDDNAEDEHGDDDDDEDDDEDDEDDEDEEDEEEEVQANEDDLDLDGYGADDQLRRNMEGSKEEEVQANEDDLDLDGYGADDQLRRNMEGSKEDDDDDGSEDGSD